MSPYRTYICNPGAPPAGRYTDEQLAEKCKCKHERAYHWWGGGSCGECARCDYFRARGAS